MKFCEELQTLNANNPNPALLSSLFLNGPLYDLTSFEKNNNIISIIISGVGDNFGRSVYMDDSHSINSFSDDLALSLPPERDLHGGVPMNILMTTSISGRANMSRSTDRNLDNLGKNFILLYTVRAPL